MNRRDYLFKIKETGSLGFQEIMDTWFFTSKTEVNNNYYVYSNETLILIKEPESPLYNNLLFVNSNYSNYEIDWNAATNLDGFVSLVAGVQLPVFDILLTKEELENQFGIDLIDYKPTLDFKPYFNNKESNSNFLINDDELIIIMSEVGVPFIDISELEYGRDEIIKYAIKPAIDVYSNYFPYIEEQNVGYFSTNKEWEVQFPEDAYAAIPYITLGINGSGGNSQLSPFGYMINEMPYLGGSGSFRGPLSYNKNTPGWVGLQGKLTGYEAAAERQGLMNQFRKEKHSVIIKDGKKYIKGFSSLGGNLNVKWLKKINNFDYVRFDQLEAVRKLCTSKVLRNFGSLRSLASTATSGAIDYSAMNNRASTLESEVISIWKNQTTNLMFGIVRGGF